MILLKHQKVIENQIVSTNILFKNFTDQYLINIIIKDYH